MRSRSIPVLVALFCACSANPRSGPPSAAPAGQPPTEQGAETAGADQSVYGLLDQDAEVFGYLHGQRLLASAAFSALVQSVLAVKRSIDPEAPDPLAELRAQCGFDPLKAVREVTFAGGPKESDLKAVLSVHGAPELLLSCVQKLESSFESARLDGHPGIRQDSLWMVSHESLVLIGSEASVRRLLSARLRPAGAAPRDVYLHVARTGDNPLGARRISFSMAEAGPGTRLVVEASASNADGAEKMESQVRRALTLLPQQASAAPKETRQAFASLLEQIELSRQGNELRASVTMDDAALTGMFAALAVYGVRRYLVEAKTKEARSTVLAIARELARHALTQKSLRFPSSAPRVPNPVPKGVRHQSKEADWAHESWRAIGFHRAGPQYYSYQYETSKDGRRVTVSARGDLDGDGIESRFELDVTIGVNGEINYGELRESNPDE